MEMFEKAAREKVRFSYRGQLSAEDMFDLSPETLNAIYGLLMKEKRNTPQDSLLEENKPDEILDLKIEIVKYVYAVKQAEADERKALAEKRAQKRRIMEIIAAKQDEALAEKSIDELSALLDNL